MHPDFELDEIRDVFVCKRCGCDVDRGILSVSGHWAVCSGKGIQSHAINKIDSMRLDTMDKMDLVKGVFNITH